MGAFGIYFIVLTCAYLIYYAVMVPLDLYGKKGKKKDTAEEFVVGSDADIEESSTVVDETEDGYSIHDVDDGLSSVDAGYGEGEHVDDGASPSYEAYEEDEEHTDDGTASEGIDATEEVSSTDDPLDDDAVLEHEAAESIADYERMKSVQEQMEIINPFYQDDYDSQSMAVLLAQPLSKKNKILSTIVNM